MDKTVRGKAAEREAELERMNTIGLSMRRGKTPILDRILGRSEYGTSLGPGAAEAERVVGAAEWEKGKSLREMEPTVRQAMREAAAEERREAKEPRKYAKGGSVRGGGCEQRGKTKGVFR